VEGDEDEEGGGRWKRKKYKKVEGQIKRSKRG
jgi:hypothetical protein